MKNLNFALENAISLLGADPLDIPYMTTSTEGLQPTVVDRDGWILPQDWTGICVSGVSTRSFWLIERDEGGRIATHLGRFRSVAEVVERLKSQIRLRDRLLPHPAL